MNMNNREAQKELCRSTKTQEEVYRIALSYERGNKYATSYVATGSVGAQGSSSGGGGIQIKSEPVGTIRGGYRNNRARGRGSYQGRGSTNRGGNLSQNNRCYNCDQQNFTREHLDRCPARGATCNFCHKLGLFERTCRGNRGNQRGRGSVGMIRENVDETHLEDSADEEASQHASSIGWVDKKPVVHSWDSSSSDGDYMVMAIKHKRFMELKVAGAQFLIKIKGKSTRVSDFNFHHWGNAKNLGSIRNKVGYRFGGGQCISGLWEQSIADDWNDGCNDTIQWLEDTREDKSNRRKPPIDNWKRFDAPIRTTVGASITGGSDNVHWGSEPGRIGARGRVGLLANLFQQAVFKPF